MQLAGERRGGRSGPSDIDGVVPRETLEPASAEEVAAVLASASKQRTSVVIRGGGTKIGWGRTPSSVDVVVSTKRLNAVVAHEHADLTATVQAGARLDEVNHILARHGQWLPIESAFDESTIGGRRGDQRQRPAASQLRHAARSVDWRSSGADRRPIDQSGWERGQERRGLRHRQNDQRIARKPGGDCQRDVQALAAAGCIRDARCDIRSRGGCCRGRIGGHQQPARTGGNRDSVIVGRGTFPPPPAEIRVHPESARHVCSACSRIDGVGTLAGRFFAIRVGFVARTHAGSLERAGDGREVLDGCRRRSGPCSRSSRS